MGAAVFNALVEAAAERGRGRGVRRRRRGRGPISRRIRRMRRRALIRMDDDNGLPRLGVDDYVNHSTCVQHVKKLEQAALNARAAAASGEVIAAAAEAAGGGADVAAATSPR